MKTNSDIYDSLFDGAAVAGLVIGACGLYKLCGPRTYDNTNVPLITTVSGFGIAIISGVIDYFRKGFFLRRKTTSKLETKVN